MFMTKQVFCSSSKYNVKCNNEDKFYYRLGSYNSIIQPLHTPQSIKAVTRFNLKILLNVTFYLEKQRPDSQEPWTQYGKPLSCPYT